MINHISVRFRVGMHPYEPEIVCEPELYIDDVALPQLFNDNELHCYFAFVPPHATLHTVPAPPYQDLVAARLHMQEAFLKWAGYSALTTDASGYPFGKIPILTCCDDVSDGYFACSISVENGLVVWRDFGIVEPDWDNSPWFDAGGNSFVFSAHSHQPVLRFEPDDYGAALQAMITDPQDYEITQPDRRKAPKYKRRVFARIRGFAFPKEQRFRLAEALALTDPLDLRRFGEVDPEIYSELPNSFWASQYKQFKESPVACLVEAFENAYGLEVRRDAVKQAVTRLTTSYK